MEKKVIEYFTILTDEIVKYNPHYDRSLIKKAFDFAYNAHKGYFRASKDPYIIHSICTAINLTKIEADDVSLVCALLHDVMDNSSYTLDIIKGKFGDEVAYIINGINILGDLYYRIDMNISEVEKLRKNLVLVGDDIRIFLVKIADRLHNLQTLEFLPIEKRYRIAKETEEIYLPIVNFLSIGEFISEIHDLVFKYTDEDSYYLLKKKFGKKYNYYIKKIGYLNESLENLISSKGIQSKINGRVKTLNSINKKINKKNINLDSIYDVLALRVITNNVEDCYKVLGIIHNNFIAKQQRFKDYISCPKDNGYQSIHTTVYDREGDLIEFQIQTSEMFKLNKSGLAAHFIYKGFGVDFNKLPESMKSILDIQKKTIDSKKFLDKLKNEVIISEIKCFDENTSRFILPKNSVLIDFAFKKSFNNGKFFGGAYINDKLIKDPFYKLKNGDFINLKMQKKIFLDYDVSKLSLIKTKKARSTLKDFFIKYSKHKLISHGEYLLNERLEVFGYKNFKYNNAKFKLDVLKNFGLKNEEQLYLFLAINSLEVGDIIDFIVSNYGKNQDNQIAYLKIKTKIPDSDFLDNILKIYSSFSLGIDSLIFSKSRNITLLSFKVSSSKDFSYLLKELQRVPNVLSVSRVFPFRLKLFYFIYFIFIFFISSYLILLNSLDFSFEIKSHFLYVFVFLSVIFLTSSIFFLQKIIKTIFPDVLKYRRFWLSIFLLTTYILSIVLWELITFELYISSVLYFIFSLFFYYKLLNDYLLYKKRIKSIR